MTLAMQTDRHNREPAVRKLLLFRAKDSTAGSCDFRELGRRFQLAEMPSKRDAALMPDAKTTKGKTKQQGASLRSQLQGSPLDVVQSIASILVRLGVFLFLRWIPTSLAWPALPIAYGVYLACWLVRDYSVRRFLRSWQNAAGGDDLQRLADAIEAKSKIGKTVGNEHQAEPKPSTNPFTVVKSILTGISIPARRVNVFNLALHSLAFALFFDSYASPYLFPSHYEHNLIFHRVADVGPTHAKVHLRWPEPIPLFEGLEEDVPGSGILRDGSQRVAKPFRLVYRELSSSASSSAAISTARWERGPLVELLPEDDWTTSVTLANLWPSTEYEYRFAWSRNNTFVSPHRLLEFEREWPASYTGSSAGESLLTSADHGFVGGRIRTWPDPRAGKGLGGLVVASSLEDENDDEYGDSVPSDDPNQ